MKVWASASLELWEPVWGFFLYAEERLCYQYCQKIGAFCCLGIENIVHLKISKSVWALSISQKNYWLVARMILHFNFLQLKLSVSNFLCASSSKTLTNLQHRRKFHMSGSCVQVQKETGVGKHSYFGDKIGVTKLISWLNLFLYLQVLPVSHLCTHLPHCHHVLDIILDQARGDSFKYPNS